METSEMRKEEDLSDNELLKVGELSYRILTPEYRDAALVLLTRAFDDEPHTLAGRKADPENGVTFLDHLELIDICMDHCSTNGMSVIAIDEKKHRIAGAFIVRDPLSTPNEYYEKYNEESNRKLTPMINYMKYLEEEAIKINPEIGIKGKSVDMWILGVHPDYRGRRIANDLIKCALPLIKKAGFKYATMEAVSAFTSKAAEFNNFQAIYRKNSKEWLWKGKPYFIHNVEPHHEAVYWVKDLEQTEI